MLKFLVPAAAALGLVAFAAQTEATDALRAGEPAMGWSLTHEGDMAKLAYGVPDSDQLALMMTCSPGDRTVLVYGDVQPDTPRMVQAAYPAPIDGLTEGEFEESRIPVGDAALVGLGRFGRLPVLADAGAFVLKADRGEQRLAREFLAYCASARA